MHCKNCGKKLSDESNYCIYCGTVNKTFMLPKFSNNVSMKKSSIIGLICLFTTIIVVGIVTYMYTFGSSTTSLFSSNKDNKLFIPIYQNVLGMSMEEIQAKDTNPMTSETLGCGYIILSHYLDEDYLENDKNWKPEINYCFDDDKLIYYEVYYTSSQGQDKKDNDKKLDNLIKYFTEKHGEPNYTKFCIEWNYNGGRILVSNVIQGKISVCYMAN